MGSSLGDGRGSFHGIPKVFLKSIMELSSGALLFFLMESNSRLGLFQFYLGQSHPVCCITVESALSKWQRSRGLMNAEKGRCRPVRLQSDCSGLLEATSGEIKIDLQSGGVKKSQELCNSVILTRQTDSTRTNQLFFRQDSQLGWPGSKPDSTIGVSRPVFPFPAGFTIPKSSISTPALNQPVHFNWPSALRTSHRFKQTPVGRLPFATWSAQDITNRLNRD